MQWLPGDSGIDSLNHAHREAFNLRAELQTSSIESEKKKKEKDDKSLAS